MLFWSMGSFCLHALLNKVGFAAPPPPPPPPIKTKKKTYVTMCPCTMLAMKDAKTVPHVNVQLNAHMYALCTTDARL